MIVAGERRWRGAVKAGLKSLAIVERVGTDSSDILVDQLVENLVREDLSGVEQGRAFRRLMDDRGWNALQLSKELNVPQPSVSQALALLDLPEPVLEKVALEELPASSAYEISKAAPEVQESLAARAVEENQTRDQTRAMVKESKGTAIGPGKGRGGKSTGPRPKSKAKTTWSVKADAGHRITVEHRKGVDLEAIPALLREVAAKAEARISAAG